MDNVQFTDEVQNEFNAASSSIHGNKGIIGFLIRKRIAKTKTQANAILIIVILISIVVGVWITKSANSTTEPAPAVKFNDVFKGRF
jgi:hypothetical protein